MGCNANGGLRPHLDHASYKLGLCCFGLLAGELANQWPEQQD